MSETVKLIIEIPEELYDTIQADEMISREQLAVLQMDILRGTSLDDVKLKIEQDMSFDMFNDYGNETATHKELWEIFDNIGKGDKECQE